MSDDKTIQAARKKKSDDDKPVLTSQPGEITSKLRRRMHDPLADMFSEVGVAIYNKAVSAIAKELEAIFEEGIGSLAADIKKKLGEYGYEESVDHFNPWMKDVVKSIFGPGMASVMGTLDGLVSNLLLKYTEENEAGSLDNDIGGLLGADIPEIDFGDVEVLEDADDEDLLSDEAVDDAEEEEVETDEPIPMTKASATTSRLPNAFRPSAEAKAAFLKSRKLHHLRMAAYTKMKELQEL